MRIQDRREVLAAGLVTLLASAAKAGPAIPDVNDPGLQNADPALEILVPKIKPNGTRPQLNTLVDDAEIEKLKTQHRRELHAMLDAQVLNLASLVEMLKTPREMKLFEKELAKQTHRVPFLMEELRRLIKARLPEPPSTKPENTKPENAKPEKIKPKNTKLETE